MVATVFGCDRSAQMRGRHVWRKPSSANIGVKRLWASFRVLHRFGMRVVSVQYFNMRLVSVRAPCCTTCGKYQLLTFVASSPSEFRLFSTFTPLPAGPSCSRVVLSVSVQVLRVVQQYDTLDLAGATGKINHVYAKSMIHRLGLIGFILCC